MRLYLVRHGETSYNKKWCYYGVTDAGLSGKGMVRIDYAFEGVERVNRCAVMGEY